MSKYSIFLLFLVGFLTSCDETVSYKKQVANDSQYLAIGRDKGGCMRYRIKSTSQMSVQVVLYRTADGSYTPNKENSVCY